MAKGPRPRPCTPFMLPIATWVCLFVAACTGRPAQGTSDGGIPEAELDAGTGGCDEPASSACLIDVYDRVAQSCEQSDLVRLRAALASRRGALPVWHDGRAVFFVEEPGLQPAGSFNQWTPGPASRSVCESEIHAVELAVPSGYHPYKLVADGTWQLDPGNWAFAYDEFAGNPDDENSLLNTPDSGVGHLIRLPEPPCSDELGDCRPITAYLPPGYDGATFYPAVLLADGQNVFDDPGCCFGNGGWHINRTADNLIGSGTIAPFVAIAVDHGEDARSSEYSGALQPAYMQHVVDRVLPFASGHLPIDSDRIYAAGSSLGGLISFELAYAYPQIFAGAASLSGSFFVGEEQGTSLADRADEAGVLDLALYLDHGGSESGGDNYAPNRRLLDALAAAGWPVELSDGGCTGRAARLCYHHAVGASHDELAWRDRSWRFLRAFLAVP